jgi:hypothetical protein
VREGEAGGGNGADKSHDAWHMGIPGSYPQSILVPTHVTAKLYTYTKKNDMESIGLYTGKLVFHIPYLNSFPFHFPIVGRDCLSLSLADSVLTASKRRTISYTLDFVDWT